jgi:hypothetical protein
MKFIATTIVCLLLVSVARADRDPEFEAGLSSIPIQGDQVLPGPSYQRNQLIRKDTTTAKTVGTAAAIIGSLSLVGGWVVYAASQNYRLQVRTELGDAVSSWETQRRWSLTLTGFGAANLVTAEAFLLSGSNPPLLAWIGAAVGVGAAAVGAGFLIGGQHCSPLAYAPGAAWPIACQSGTADATFGPLIILSALPLIALPITYAVRGLFAETQSLTFNGTSLQWNGVF